MWKSLDRLQRFTGKQKGATGYKLEKIEIRFTEVMNLSEQIGAVACEISNLAEDKLLQISGSTKRAWQSGSAELLCKKEVMISEQLAEEAERIRKISLELAEAAGTMYLAERANNLLAGTRIYL